ncbi:MAG: hypothetical protein GY869_04995, partial [Planctomycetes bacterium]|nr:hypothetical protein [Planctomycetota bacterium]
LDVDFFYENPLGTTESLNAGENVTVGRGNLVLRKTPKLQNGTYADVITWNILVANTGLGDVYSTTLTDTIGVGYNNVAIDSLNVTPFHLAIGEDREFTVTARINSCHNLTNTVDSWWSIGNENGTGTTITPVQDAVDVAYLIAIPNISISSNAVDFDYCTQDPETVVITITAAANSAPAIDFELESTQ